MPSPQFIHVIEIVEQLESSTKHMKNKWEMIQSQGYLPSTNIFVKIQKKVEELRKDLENNRITYLKLFQEQLPKNKCDINSESDYHRFTSIKCDFNYNELLFREEISDFELNKLKESDLKLHISKLNNIKNNLYYRVEAISDMLNAVNYSFVSRLSGVFSPETTLAKDIATKKFGGIQLVHDAAESIMKDYVTSFVDEDYNGLVIFGFRNRAITYPTSIVVFPSFSEYDLEYLTILAHESFHFIHSNFESEKKTVGFKISNCEQENYIPKIETYFSESEVAIKKSKNKLIKILKPLTQVYSPEDYTDKNVSKEIVAEALAYELMADIYATFIAGESYPLILYNYYLPMLSTIEEGHFSELDYSVFNIGSLKLRVSLATLERIFETRKFEIDKLKFKVQKKELGLGELYNEISKWENLSINLTKFQKREKRKQKYKAVSIINDKVPEKDYKLTFKEQIIMICDEINREGIIDNMEKLIKCPFYPVELSYEDFRKKILKISNIFKNTPTQNEIFKIWDEYPWFKPKHSISMLANYSINRNALLISLAYHENIIQRFQR